MVSRSAGRPWESSAWGEAPPEGSREWARPLRPAARARPQGAWGGACRRGGVGGRHPGVRLRMCLAGATTVLRCPEADTAPLAPVASRCPGPPRRSTVLLRTASTTQPAPWGRNRAHADCPVGSAVLACRVRRASSWAARSWEAPCAGADAASASTSPTPTSSSPPRPRRTPATGSARRDSRTSPPNHPGCTGAGHHGALVLLWPHQDAPPTADDSPGADSSSHLLARELRTRQGRRALLPACCPAAPGGGGRNLPLAGRVGAHPGLDRPCRQ